MVSPITAGYQAEIRPTVKSINETSVSTMQVETAESGDEIDFVDNPSEELHCSVCLSVLRNPHLTSCCGNHFCQRCIERIQADGKPCPLCQSPEYTVMLDKSVMRRVKQLKVWCPKRERGCKWIGELGETHKHLENTCDFVDVTCSLLCGAEVPRYDLSNHRANVCPNRTCNCPYCDLQATYAVVTEKHWLECESYPLECPNACGVDHVKRKDLPAHLGVCPLEMIECEFSTAGCDAKVSRKEMPRHVDEGVLSHVALIPIICSRFEEKLEMKDKALVEALADLNQKCSHFEEKLEMKDQALAEVLADFNQELEKKTNGFQATILTQQREIEQLKARLQKAEEAIQLESIKPPPVEFVMTNFDTHYHEEDQWFSPPFYSHEGGYQMCLSVFAYGAGQARGNHASVFANLMRGKHDDKLNWPFRGCVKVEVHTDDYEYDETLKFSSRTPAKAANRVWVGERNEYGQGCVKCVPHDEISPLPSTLRLRVCSVTVNS